MGDKLIKKRIEMCEKNENENEFIKTLTVETNTFWCGLPWIKTASTKNTIKQRNNSSYLN